MPRSTIATATNYINERSYIPWVAAGAVLACALVATHVFSEEPAAKIPAPVYVVVEPARPDSAASLSVSGIVQSAQPVEVGAVTGGHVIRLMANVGDVVIEGQVLAMLDGRMAGFRQAQAKSELKRASALAQERAAAAQRAEALSASGAMSIADRDTARAEAIAASSALDAARAASGLARTEAEYHVIRAPGTGVISARSVELGGVVALGQALFSIDARQGGMIVAAVPAKLAPLVRPGDRVSYRSDSTQGMARVVGASPRIEAGGVALVRLVIETGSPPPGAIVGLRMGSGDGHADQVRVPLSALQSDQQGRRFLYTLGRDNRAQRVPVQLTELNGADARVRGALVPGARIIAAGAAFLRPGQPVRIAKLGA